MKNVLSFYTFTCIKSMAKYLHFSPLSVIIQYISKWLELALVGTRSYIW